ncbi:exosortase [Corallincola platygyrae]|uniref:Exosortase n=1 Tax=Corallincola platygyrae TaxID=1193278 RepID=A0ABW4XLY7_9GAMM
METAKKIPWNVIVPPMLVVLVGWLYWSTMGTLWQRWWEFDESYGHGLLLMGVILWWCHDQRVVFRSLPLSPLLIGVVPLLISVGLWWVAAATDILVVQQVLLPWIWWSAVLLVAGPHIAKQCFFPALLFCFAVPIWDHINDYLIDLTVVVTTSLLSLHSMPVLIQGNEIHLPSGIITVADGCSGLRYLIIGMAFSLLSGQLFFKSWRWRLSLLGLGLFLGLFTNWLRVYSLIIIGYVTEMQSGLLEDHELYGFVLFGIIFSIMFFLVRWRGDNSAPKPVEGMPASRTPGLPQTIMGFVIVVVAPLSLAVLIKTPPVAEFRSPVLVSEYPEVIQPPAAMTPAYFRPIERAERVTQWFKVAQQPVLLERFYYWQQQERQDFMPYRWLFARNQWVTLASEQRLLADGTPIIVKEMEPRTGPRQVWLVGYWMTVGGAPQTNPYMAKLAELPALWRQRHDAALVSLQLPCKFDCSEARQALAQVLSSQGEQLQQQLASRWQLKQ